MSLLRYCRTEWIAYDKIFNGYLIIANYRLDYNIIQRFIEIIAEF